MTFGPIAYPKKPLIIAHSGVSRETRYLKVFGVFYNLHTLFMRENESPGEVMHTYRLTEPWPHSDVIRTIISCAVQFIVLFFSLQIIIFFSYLNS